MDSLSRPQAMRTRAGVGCAFLDESGHFLAKKPYERPLQRAKSEKGGPSDVFL